MEKYPEKSRSDNINLAIKAVTSAIPYAGGPLSILFESIFTSPIEKRKEDWFKSLGSAIVELTERVEVLTTESLSNDEKFISISMQATQIALRNHQKEKLDALRNCVINSIIITSIDENKALLFTRIVDEITPLHIQLLSFLKDPKIIEEKLQSLTNPSSSVQSSVTNYSSNAEIWFEYFPEFKKSEFIINFIINDLFSKGFISTDNINMGHGIVIKDFGREFLTFISSSDET
jgi:hypothetical protein